MVQWNHVQVLIGRKERNQKDEEVDRTVQQALELDYSIQTAEKESNASVHKARTTPSIYPGGFLTLFGTISPLYCSNLHMSPLGT